MMQSRIPLETYFSTPYDPDVEYVDGKLQNRNVGEYDHCIMQREILSWFHCLEKEWRIRSILNQRTCIDPTKILIPDVLFFA
jgi:hypothetical protein